MRGLRRARGLGGSRSRQRRGIDACVARLDRARPSHLCDASSAGGRNRVGRSIAEEAAGIRGDVRRGRTAEGGRGGADLEGTIHYPGPSSDPCSRVSIHAGQHQQQTDISLDRGDGVFQVGWDDVRGFLSLGGTLIGTARSAEFRELEGRRKAVLNLVKHGIEALIVCGGDGSLTGADRLRAEWSDHLKTLKHEGGSPADSSDARQS